MNGSSSDVTDKSVQIFTNREQAQVLQLPEGEMDLIDFEKSQLVRILKTSPGKVEVVFETLGRLDIYYPDHHAQFPKLYFEVIILPKTEKEICVHGER